MPSSNWHFFLFLMETFGGRRKTKWGKFRCAFLCFPLQSPMAACVHAEISTTVRLAFCFYKCWYAYSLYIVHRFQLVAFQYDKRPREIAGARWYLTCVGGGFREGRKTAILMFHGIASCSMPHLSPGCTSASHRDASFKLRWR